MNPTYLEHSNGARMVVYDHGKLARSLKAGWMLCADQPDGGQKPEPTVAAEPVEPTGTRVVGVDVDGDGRIDKVFPEKKKPGRPKKAK